MRYTSSRPPCWLRLAGLLFLLAPAQAARAEEIWVAPTSQADVGGLELASNTFWPVTPIGAVRFAFHVPADFESLLSAKIAIIPGASSASSSLSVFVCAAIDGTMAGANCQGPFAQSFTSTANRLKELDITSAFASSLTLSGTRPYLAVLAFTQPTTTTDHFVGLRFASHVGIRTDSSLTVLGNNAFRFLTGAGLDNTAIGSEAMMFGWKGNGNTAVGSNAMFGLGETFNTGNDNTAIGNRALNQITTGSANVAVGARALLENTTGSDNIAIGASANAGTGGGVRNIAIGSNTLNSFNVFNDNVVIGHNAGRGGTRDTALGGFTLAPASPFTAGHDSIAIGYRAGFGTGAGSHNIHVGNEGVEEWNTLRIGTPFDAGASSGQNRAFIAGIRGVTTGAANAIPVVIDSNGQLGTVSSSRRFKEDIRDMSEASRRLFALRPVTFRYAEAFAGGTKPIQFGLVAEEVADVFPELAVRDNAGRVETVHYETLSVLLLNELQRQEKRIADQEQRLAEMERRIKALDGE